MALNLSNPQREAVANMQRQIGVVLDSESQSLAMGQRLLDSGVMDAMTAEADKTQFVDPTDPGNHTTIAQFLGGAAVIQGINTNTTLEQKRALQDARK